MARIRAVTRRTTEPELVEPVQLGRWTVDLSDHVISKRSKPVSRHKCISHLPSGSSSRR